MGSANVKPYNYKDYLKHKSNRKIYYAKNTYFKIKQPPGIKGNPKKINWS
jgi:hypothetical protein